MLGLSLSRLLSRFVRCVPLAGALGLTALAGTLVGCASPEQPLPGATGALPGTAAGKPWKTQASVSVEAVRALSEPEGELVMASAIAEHEMRRP